MFCYELVLKRQSKATLSNRNIDGDLLPVGVIFTHYPSVQYFKRKSTR